MVDKKYVGITIFLIATIIMVPLALSMFNQPEPDLGLDPFTPYITPWKDSTNEIEYSEISEYVNYEVKYPKDLGLPDLVLVQNGRDFTYLVYKNGKISNDELDKLLKTRNSHEMIINAGGIVLEVYVNNMDNATILTSVNNKVEGSNGAITKIDVNGHIGTKTVSESVTLIRWYTKTSVYLLGANPDTKPSGLLDIAKTVQ